MSDSFVNDPLVKEIKQVADVASAFFSAGAATVQIAEFLVDFMDLGSPRPDPVLSAVHRVSADLGRVEDLELATWASARRERLSFIEAHSAVALRITGDFIRSGAAPTDPFWIPRLSDALTLSDLALQTLTANLLDGVWVRPDNPKAIAQDGNPFTWMNILEDRPEQLGFGNVWDYRWGLAATLHAIYARLCVIRVCQTDRGLMQREYRRMGRVVNFVFRKMDSGVRSHTLTEDDIRRIPTHGGAPVAVVDIYGGRFVAGLMQFTPRLENFEHSGVEFPAELLIPVFGGSIVSNVVRNAETLTRFWEGNLRARIGLLEVLRLAGQLENLLLPTPSPAPQPLHSKLVYVGGRVGFEGQHFRGILMGVDREDLVRWYQYEGNGESDVSGASGWTGHSSNPIANGWSKFRHLVGVENGVVLGVDNEGFLIWLGYVGSGNLDPSGSINWHRNAGNAIGNGWERIIHLAATPGPKDITATLYAVEPTGELRWFRYTGRGEQDDGVVPGWHPNSGNRIGNGWHTLSRLVGAGRSLYGVMPDGTLRWFRYDGEGEEDVSGSSGWAPNSGNPIGRGWNTLRLLCGGFVDPDTEGLFGVAENGDLRWFTYIGDGTADPTGGTGWGPNSGNPIGNGW